MSFDQAILEIEKLIINYGFAVSKIQISRNTNLLKPNSDVNTKTVLVKPYHLVQIILGEITNTDSKINVRKIYDDLGEKFVSYIVERVLNDEFFKKIQPPLKPEEAFARLVKFGFRRSNIVGYDFKEEGKDKNGNTELHRVITEKKQVIDYKLIEKFANEPNYNWEYPIHTAAKEGNIAILNKLLDTRKVDINALDINYLTPLAYAVSAGQEKAVELLLKQGANLNLKLGEDKSVLHLSVEKGDRKTCMLLCDKGADVNASYAEGVTPLNLALRRSNIEIATLLCDKGAKIDSSYLGMLALMKRVQSVKFLILKGADVNQPDLNGYTPLHMAVRSGAIEVVRELLECDKIDVHAKTKDGNTPLDLASEEIKELLEDYIKTKDEQTGLLLSVGSSSKQRPAEKQGTTAVPSQGIIGSLVSISTDIYKSILDIMTDGVLGTDAKDTSKKPGDDQRSK